jgi:hypothetical protein
MGEVRLRRLPVVAQDPGVAVDGRILTSWVSVPFEDLEPGPVGHRVHVVDYDTSSRTLYRGPALGDEQAKAPSNATILRDPRFHAQNVYALVMATLSRFEFALGRRVGWSFRAHQLKVVPHAFEAANAYYSPDSEALLFGHFKRGRQHVFTCLSHDIVVHETTHALLDGLRGRFMAPSSPDQAAFHEGYADVVALLSVFNLTDVLGTLVNRAATTNTGARAGLIHRDLVTSDALRSSVLFGLAEEMESEITGARISALRRSVDLEPDTRALQRAEFLEPHRRGEVFVAAMMRTFLQVWANRLEALGTIDRGYLDRGRVIEEGTGVAEQLLTMAIRAIDYAPPIHLTFGDFLSAMLTADSEVRNDDSRYGLWEGLRKWFAAYGITPASPEANGLWKRTDVKLTTQGVRFGNLQTDPTEMFRLVWANRRHLSLDIGAYTRIASVRPCLRIGPDDGMPVRETVAECTQYLALTAAELRQMRLRKPIGMPDDTKVVLEGGSTLILDEYGVLKFEIHNRLAHRGDEHGLAVAQGRLDYLWEQGFFDKGASFAARLSTLHRERVFASAVSRDEVW